MGIGSIEILLLLPLLLGANGGFGVPLGMPPGEEDPMMSKVAPEECIFYASWAGTKTPDPNANPTEKWLAQKGVQEAIAKIQQVIVQSMANDRGNRSDAEIAATENAARLIAIMLRSPCACYIEQTPDIFSGMVPMDGDADDDVNRFSGAFVSAPGQSSAEFKKYITQINEFLEQDEVISEVRVNDTTFWQFENNNGPFEVMSWGFVDEYFVVAFGENALKGVLENMASPAPSWVSELREQSGIKRLASVSMINIQAYFALHKVNDRDFLATPIRELGLSNAKHINWATGLDENGFVSKTNIVLDGEPEGIFKIVDGEPIPNYVLYRIPKENTLAFATRFSAAETYEMAKKFFSMVDQPESFDDGIAQFETMTGVQVKRDIVDALSGVMYLYTDFGIVSPFEGWVLSIGVENEMTFGPTIKKLTEFFKETSQMEINSSTVEGYEVYSVERGPGMFGAEPCWCVGNREFLIAMSTKTIEQHLKREATADSSLASSAGIKRVMADSKSDPLIVSTLDFADLLREIYPSFMSMIADSMVEEMQRQGIEFEKSDIPSLETLTNEVEPCVSAVFKTTDGFQIVQRQTYPGGSVGTTIAGVVAIGSTASIVGAAGLNQIESSNKLRQAAIALHNYHDVHGSFPTAYSVSPERKPLLSWRVHILPYIEQNELYEKFKLDEPWDSEHNRKLIELMPKDYAFPGDTNTKNGKTRILANATESGAFAVPKNGEKTRGTRFADVRDGTSNTILLIEVSEDNAVEWTKPADFDQLPVMDYLEDFRGNYRNGFNAALCDGSTFLIPFKIDLETLKNALNRNDGNITNLYQLMRGDDIGESKSARPTVEDSADDKPPTEDVDKDKTPNAMSIKGNRTTINNEQMPIFNFYLGMTR